MSEPGASIGAVPDGEQLRNLRRFTTTGYLPELDGLRGISVILVILFHSDPGGPFRGGFIGVDVFFVLSAFLISSLLAEEMQATGRIRLRHFYWHRALRLMPALILFLAGYLIAAPIIWPNHPHIRDAAIAGLYISNFTIVAASLPTFITHTWSLAAEQQFYLIWPILFAFLLRAKNPLVILGAVWLGLSLWRALPREDWTSYYYDFGAHGSGLVMGAILFFLLHGSRQGFGPIHAAMGAVLIGFLSVTALITDSVLAIGIAEVGAALLIGAVVSGGAGLGILAATPLVALGRLSYGMYLWHYPISRALRDDWNFWPTFVTTLALSLVAALVSYNTVEAWARRWKATRRV